MAKKKQPAFLLQKSQKSIVDELTNEEAGILFKAIYEYETTKATPKLGKVLNIVFKQFKISLDDYDAAYEEKCKKNKEKIENYWSEIKDTNVYSSIPMYTNKNKIKENKNKINNNTGGVGGNNIIQESINDNTLFRSTTNTHTPTLSELRSFCDSNGMSQFDCEYFFNYYEANGWTNKNGTKVKNWQARVKNWYADDVKNGKIKIVDTSRRLE